MRSVRVPVTQFEHTALRAAAHRAGRPLATWMREHALTLAGMEINIAGSVVDYRHPDWGECRGTVLRTDGEGGALLVQDHAVNGARDWIQLAWLKPHPESHTPSKDEEVKR